MQLLRDVCLCNNSRQTTLGAFRVTAGTAAIDAIHMSPEWGSCAFSPVRAVNTGSSPTVFADGAGYGFLWLAHARHT
jgi:hypothetical protein